MVTEDQINIVCLEYVCVWGVDEKYDELELKLTSEFAQ